MENDFLNKVNSIIEENISNEQFGVSELASAVDMSRSNLLRKIKKITNLSASQYIRKIRLEFAMELLKETSLTASEVSYKVGFNSTSYFIKCFHDEYGFPPGKIKDMESSELETEQYSESEQKHQLAAIIFADIEGYTAIMQKDEQKALEIRKRHREVLESVTKKYNGKILQFYGDGTLSTFNSAIDAVKCGIDIQIAFLNKPQVPLRIGIHSGDIIFTKEGIIGDGVNVASRIEALAESRSVLISEKIYDEIKNQPEIQSTTLGKFQLKNVEKSLEVYAISNPGVSIPTRAGALKKLGNNHSGKSKGLGFKKRKIEFIGLAIILLAVLIGYFLIPADFINLSSNSTASGNDSDSKKSIAVLPFINDSNDSTNVYIINGLMESLLNNLQKVEGLRVISRTSMEKYRRLNKSIPEIAKELNVRYFVEGSGQKIGDQILLSIQLIEGPTDRHLWGEQYNREASDIFNLQKEVAKNITGEIQVFITPEEEKRIEKKPTENIVAYDLFLQGRELMEESSPESIEKAITILKKAIDEDPEFARAYAAIAISFYFLDYYQTEKIYIDSINFYADKALFYDSDIAQSLIAKGLYYMNIEEYNQAISYFERTLKIHPGNDLVYLFLVDLYANHFPDSEKYLEYALRGLQIDVVAAYDSVTASFSYLHISNAFIQNGFVGEAEKYINKSLDYFPENIYSQYVKAYILYAKNNNLEQTKDMLLKVLQKDTTRIDVLQEVGKMYYYLRDYTNAWKYYQKFLTVRSAYNLQIYHSEDAKIGLVLNEVGLKEESATLFAEFKSYAENDPSLYKHINLAMYYSYQNEPLKALEHLDKFSNENNFHYWTLLFVDQDPTMDNIKDYQEYKKLLKTIEKRFWMRHEQLKNYLEKEKLI